MLPFLALAVLLCAPAGAEGDPKKAFDLPPSAVPAPGPRAGAVPPAPPEPPALEGAPRGPVLRGPVEPEPALEPSLLASPVPVDAKLFSRVVDHVRKHCSTDEESGLCCLMGQSPLKRKAATRTACLEIETPEQEGPVRDLVYREVFTGLTIVSAQAKGKPPVVEYVTLEMAMGGSVAQVEMEAEGEEGTRRRADPLKPGEAEKLFESAAKDLLTIAPTVKI